MVGLAQGPSNSVLPVFINLRNDDDKIGPYVTNYPFNFGPMLITMFNLDPKTQPQTNGYVDMYRFIILNNLSPAINFVNRERPNVQALINNRGSEYD